MTAHTHGVDLRLCRSCTRPARGPLCLDCVALSARQPGDFPDGIGGTPWPSRSPMLSSTQIAGSAGFQPETPAAQEIAASASVGEHTMLSSRKASETIPGRSRRGSAATADHQGAVAGVRVARRKITTADRTPARGRRS